MSELYNIVQKHMDAYGPSAAELARRIGAAPQTVSSWKTRGLRAMPEKRLLVALSRLTHTPYGDVLLAALHDSGYLPEESASERRPTKTQATEDEIREESLPGGGLYVYGVVGEAPAEENPKDNGKQHNRPRQRNGSKS